MSQNYGNPGTGQMVTLMDNEVEVVNPISIGGTVDVQWQVEVTNTVDVNISSQSGPITITTVDGPLDVEVTNPVEIITSAPLDVNISTPLDINSLPAVDINSLPAVDINSLPAVDINSLPAVDINSLPAVDINSLPAVDINSLPDVVLAPGQSINIGNKPDVDQQASDIWTVGWYGNKVIADIPSSSLTTTATTATIIPSWVDNPDIWVYSHLISVNVSGVTGTNPTLDVIVEESNDGLNWKRVYEFARITANGVYNTPLMKLTGSRIRYVQTVGGTTPNFTRSIDRVISSSDTALIKQFIDRTIVSTTVGSTTPITGNYSGWFDVRWCNQFTLVVSRWAGGGWNVWVVLDGSFDWVSWFQISAATLNAGLNSTVSQSTNNVLVNFIRARISNANAWSTLNYVSIIALWLS